MENKLFDWQQVIERMMLNLAELRDHIKEHDFIACGPEVQVEINGAIDIWAAFQNVWNQDGASFEAEGDMFEALMDYLKTHMRNWWD